MPYIILIVGVLIGLYALYRCFLTASVDQVKALFIAAAFVVLCVAMFFLALTGRFGAAVAILLVATPIFWPFIKKKLNIETPEASSALPMTREEALKILDIYDGASEEEINDAYKRLMQKVHPDNQGSDWMAVKLNQARDLLLKK
jgi:hypothetical protein